MRIFLYPLLFVSMAASSRAFAAILIDDFSLTSLPLIITDTTADGSFETSGLDFAPGSLFDRRYALVLLDIGSGSVEARITDGVARITTTSEATGRFYLYHDSVSGGPYLDMSNEYTDDGGIALVFASATSGSLSVTLALQSVTGRLLGNFNIPNGVFDFFVPFGSFGRDDSFDPSRVYETRVFFGHIGPGTTLEIDSISVVPESGTALFLIAPCSALLNRRRRPRGL